jgi:hypothetical protein
MSFVDLQKLFNHNNIMLLPKSSQNIKSLVKYKKFPIISPREHAQHFHSPIQSKHLPKASFDTKPSILNLKRPDVVMLKELFKEKFEKMNISKYPSSSLKKKPVTTSRKVLNKKIKKPKGLEPNGSQIRVSVFKRFISSKPLTTRKVVTRPPTPLTCASHYSPRPIRTPDGNAMTRKDKFHNDSDEDKIDNTTYLELYSKYL